MHRKPGKEDSGYWLQWVLLTSCLPMVVSHDHLDATRFPWGCSDDALPWSKASELPEGTSPLETKSPYVCHAEMNAILNKNAEQIKGCRIYVALFPCNECA